MRLGYTIPRAALDEVGNCLLVGVLCQQDEGNGNAGMEELSYKVHRFGISGVMFEQKQSIALLLQHHLGVLQRGSMIEVRR